MTVTAPPYTARTLGRALEVVVNFVKVALSIIFLGPFLLAKVIWKEYTEEDHPNLKILKVGGGSVLVLLVSAVYIYVWWYFIAPYIFETVLWILGSIFYYLLAVPIIWVIEGGVGELFEEVLSSLVSALQWYWSSGILRALTYIGGTLLVLWIRNKRKLHREYVEDLKTQLYDRDEKIQTLIPELEEISRELSRVRYDAGRIQDMHIRVYSGLDAIHQWAEASKEISRSKTAERMRKMIELVRKNSPFEPNADEDANQVSAWLKRFEEKLETEASRK